MKTLSAFPLQHDSFEQVYEYSQNHCVQFGGNGRSRLGAAILCLTGMGLVYQSIATILDHRNHPLPGRLVDVNGCHLHLQSAGSGTPTVVLEAGLGGMSSVWAWIQPETAKFPFVEQHSSGRQGGRPCHSGHTLPVCLVRGRSDPACGPDLESRAMIYGSMHSLFASQTCRRRTFFLRNRNHNRPLAMYNVSIFKDRLPHGYHHRSHRS